MTKEELQIGTGSSVDWEAVRERCRRAEEKQIKQEELTRLAKKKKATEVIWTMGLLIVFLALIISFGSAVVSFASLLAN
jgi:hypothetical protein